jgi:hypothetical protein
MRYTHDVLITKREVSEPSFCVREETETEKKLNQFRGMSSLHALFNRAGVEHENVGRRGATGFMKSKERF